MKPILPRNVQSCRKRRAALAAVVAAALAGALATCGPVHFVNVGKRFELLRPVYEQTTSSLGRDELEAMLADASDRDHVAVASQELPFTFDTVWRTIQGELAAYPPESFTIDRRTGTVTIDLLRVFAISILEYELFQQSWMKIVPTPYGTTVVHLGLLRYEARGEALNAPAPRSAAGGRLEDLTRSLEVKGAASKAGGGVVTPEPASSASPATSLSAGLEPIPVGEAFRYAVISLDFLVRKIAPDLTGDDLAREVHERRQDHRLRTTAPSGLELAAEFIDGESLLPNGLLDPGESAQLELVVRNGGPGTAFEVNVVLQGRPASLLDSPEVAVGDLDPGESFQLAVTLRPPPDMTSSTAVVTLEAFERRGYGANPLVIELPVAPLVLPTLEITAVAVDDRSSAGGDGDGLLGAGETVDVVATVANTGSGAALRVGIDLRAEAIGIEGRTEVAAVPPGRSVDVRLPFTLPRTLDAPSLFLGLEATDGRGEDVAVARWTGELPVTSRRPLLELAHRLFDGDSPLSEGDRDGVAENGERVEVEISVANRGRLTAEAVEVALSSIGGIEPRPARIILGDLPPGAEAAPQRVAFQVPRVATLEGPLLLQAKLSQRDFGPAIRAMELPFTRRAPDLRLASEALVPVVAGRIERRLLHLANLGSLSAEGVTVTVTPAGEGLEILGSAGEPATSWIVPVGSLDGHGGATEIPLTLFARRGRSEGGAALEVAVAQRDFETLTSRVAVPVLEEAPTRIHVSRGAEVAVEPADSDSPPDSTPPALWILEPDLQAAAGTLRVDMAEIEVRGQVSDASGVYSVRVEEESVEVESEGRFSTWVRLGYGLNQIEIEVVDTRGNLVSSILSVERIGTRGDVRSDRALIFATDRYEHWPALTNPVHDARVMAAVLESLYGFEVEIVADPTKEEVLRTLRRYAALRPGPDDQLLVFFGGHGHYDETFREGYVITRESLRMDEIGKSFLSYSQLATILDSLLFQHVLVALDVCFGGTFDQRLREAGYRGEPPYADVSDLEFIQRTLSRTTRLYLAAGGKEYVPEGRPGRHSPFVARILDALHSGGGRDGILTMGEVLGFLERLEPEPRAGSFGQNELGSDFLFVKQRK